MAQHFLLSSAAKTLSLAIVMRMTEKEAETVFRRVRWASTGGAAVCPHCGCSTTYECRRPSGALRFRCKSCRKDFSITSGTIFASHKMPLRNYLAAIAIFMDEVKGKSALALSRDLGTAYKTAFVLAHKLREAMANEMKGMRINDAEKSTARKRMAETSNYHQVSDLFLIRYAREVAWREAHNLASSEHRTAEMTGLTTAAPISVDWCGYWQQRG